MAQHISPSLTRTHKLVEIAAGSPLLAARLEAITLCSGLLVLAFNRRNMAEIALACLLPAVAWALGTYRGARHVSGAVFTAYAGLIALGGGLGVSIGWLAPALTSALIAWDLDGFAQWLQAAGRVAQREKLVRRHLGRLAVVAGLGMASATAGPSIRLDLSFEMALVLGLLAVLAIGRVLAQARRSSSPGEYRG